MGSPDVPLGALGCGGGSSLTQVAPICRQRIRAAGAGRFSAKLRMRTPLSGSKGLGVVDWTFCVVMGRSVGEIVFVAHDNGCPIASTG